MKRRQTGPERLLDNVRLVGGPLRGGTISTASGSRMVERATGGLCEVHFLPLVVEVGDGNRTQRLRCVGKSTFFSPTLPFCGFCMLSLLRGALHIWSFVT